MGPWFACFLCIDCRDTPLIFIYCIYSFFLGLYEVLGDVLRILIVMQYLKLSCSIAFSELTSRMPHHHVVFQHGADVQHENFAVGAYSELFNLFLLMC